MRRKLNSRKSKASRPVRRAGRAHDWRDERRTCTYAACRKVYRPARRGQRFHSARCRALWWTEAAYAKAHADA